VHLFRGLRGYGCLSSGSHSPPHFGFRHEASNWHDFRDCGSLDLCSCQHSAHNVSIWGLRLLHGVDGITEVYVPSTMVASGDVASAP
jgi:hypothetical protein